MSEPSDSQLGSTNLDTAAPDPAAADVASEVTSNVTWPGNLGTGTVRDVASIGNYRLIEQIGAGGMGVVYKAEQLRPVKRTVALKLIKFGMDTPQVVARFASERQALALLEHPGVARVYDAGATDTGRPYFVMEYVPGQPITDYCDAHILTTRQRLELFMQVCDAVQHAHFRGILHRDLKPSNILVGEVDGKPQPKVIDFGVAKATQPDAPAGTTMATVAGQLVGTPFYMSPEQAAGEDVDTRADVYSLGVVLYELLAGALPLGPSSVRGADSVRIVKQLLEHDPPRPSTRVTAPDRRGGVDDVTLRRQLRGDLDRVVMKAIHKDRAQRYATPAALAEDVRRHLNHEPVTARPPTLAYQARKFARRNRVLVSATVMVGMAIVFGLAAATIGLVRARQALSRESQARQAETASRLVAQNVGDFLRDMLKSADPKRAQGKDVLVRDVLDRAAADLSKRFPDQPVVAAALHKAIGDTYDSLALFPQAHEHSSKALELRRAALGPDHPDTLDTANSLGHMLRAMGKYKESEEMLRDVLERRGRLVGRDDPVTTHAEQGLALTLLALERPEEAERMMRHVIDVRREKLGNDHEETLSAMHNLAAIEQNLGRPSEAQALLRGAAEGRERTLGPNHPTTILTWNNLAGTMVMQQRYADAEKLFRDVLARNERILGKEHKQTFEGLNNLAFTLQQMERLPEAETLYREMLERARISLPENHRTTLAALGNLALVLEEQKKDEEALKCFAELAERARVAEIPRVIVARYVAPYALRLYKYGHYDRAEPALLEAKRLLEETNQNNSPAMRDTLAGLAVICRKAGRDEEADKWRDELARLTPATTPAMPSASQQSR